MPPHPPQLCAKHVDVDDAITLKLARPAVQGRVVMVRHLPGPGEVHEGGSTRGSLNPGMIYSQTSRRRIHRGSPKNLEAAGTALHQTVLDRDAGGAAVSGLFIRRVARNTKNAPQVFSRAKRPDYVSLEATSPPTC